MKKMKKLLAILMTMAMVMGLSITGFAAQRATVTINNLDKDATVQYVQIIEPSTTAPTGWQFTEAGNDFKTSISNTADAQDVIWGLLKYKTSSLEVPNSAVHISASLLEQAFEAVTVTDTAPVSDGSATFNPTVAGVYAIKATSTNTKYTYSAMGAYVKFAYGADGSAEGVDDTEIKINAKSTSTPTTKEASEDIQAIGRDVTYTVTTTVPYIKESVTNVDYKVTDTITGAEYKLETTEGHEGKLKVIVTLTGENPKEYYVDVNKGKFTLNLSDIAANRTNANKTLTISYVATVTDLVVNNEVKVNEGSTELSSDTENVYSSAVTMTKTSVENQEQLLGGAGFKVYYVDDNNTTYWATAVPKTNEEEVAIAGQYKVTGWVTSEENATEIFTATEGTDIGKVTLDGLDGTTQYKFKETTAPTGYSLNKDASNVTWDNGNDDSGKVGTASMADTKLSELPSTGGMGTTLFTIAGCVIMISAAGLFFATRKKAN